MSWFRQFLAGTLPSQSGNATPNEPRQSSPANEPRLSGSSHVEPPPSAHRLLEETAEMRKDATPVLQSATRPAVNTDTMTTPPAIPAEPGNPSGVQHKVVPFAAAVAHNQGVSHLATQLESLIASYAGSGWEYVGFHQIQTFKAGTAGCFGTTFGAVAPTTITMEFVVFRK